MADEVLACEFGAGDLEFAWTPEETVDPVAQEQMLASYTSRGILTLNEARAVLGREPLAVAAADTPMALTGAGYVALGKGVQTSSDRIGKGGAWDESQHSRWAAGAGDHQGGRFAPADAGSASPHPQLAFAGTLIDKRYDEVIGKTHCTYLTPLGSFKVEHNGHYFCDDTYPAPY